MRLLAILNVLAPAFCINLIDVRPSNAATSGPWCAHVGMGDDYMGDDCSMPSYRMCRENIHGLGGYCFENPNYPAVSRPTSRAKRTVNKR